MPVTILPTRQPLDATQQGSLRKLFDSPAFSLLKEVVVARCIEHQIAAMAADLYPGNEVAVADAAAHKAAAILHSSLLDVLDDLTNKEQEWATVKIEPHR